MKVFLGICLETFAPAPNEDPNFILQRGKEYTISAPRDSDGTVMLFSQYWIRVPAKLFGGVIPQ